MPLTFRIKNLRMLTYMKRNDIAWYLWFVGTILVVLSWVGTVSTKVGWLGFGIGLVGTIMSWGLRPPHSNPRSDNDDFKK